VAGKIGAKNGGALPRQWLVYADRCKSAVLKIRHICWWGWGGCRGQGKRAAEYHAHAVRGAQCPFRTPARPRGTQGGGSGHG